MSECHRQIFRLAFLAAIVSCVTLATPARADEATCCLDLRAAHGEARSARDVAKQHVADLNVVAAAARKHVLAAQHVALVAEQRLAICLERLASERDRVAQTALEFLCRKNQVDVQGARESVREREAELDSMAPRLDAATVALERAEKRLRTTVADYAGCARKCPPGSVDEAIAEAVGAGTASASPAVIPTPSRAPGGGRPFFVDSKLGASFGLGTRPNQLASVLAPSLALRRGGSLALALPLQLLAAPERITLVAPIALQYEAPLGRGLSLSLRAGGGYFWEQGAAGFDRGPAVLAEAGLTYAIRPGVRVGAEPASALVLFGRTRATMLRFFAWFGVDL